MTEIKIKPEHMQRNAYVYIRQSTLRQVVEHTESTERQYQLKARASAMGWAAAHIIVVDESKYLFLSDIRSTRFSYRKGY